MSGDEAVIGRHLQRAARAQVHVAADAAFVQACFQALVELDVGEHVGRHQRVVERARQAGRGIGRGDVVAVQFGQRELGGKAADADRLAFAGFAADDHARHVRQRIGDVLGGELRDVLRVDHLDDGVGIALVLHVLVDRLAIAGDATACRLVALVRAALLLLVGLSRRRAVGRLSAGGAAVAGAVCGTACWAWTTPGMPKQAPNDRVAAASAAYSGLRAKTCGW